MAIPPFPSQDLAKLVLGYLAEEQLMTAYDEFLQASPYLDALGNEYDRIFMTSLKNILAEYRAVKIYVETCKPFILRKKVFQCQNLLEMVKFLIQNIDINKIQMQENNLPRYSVEKQNSFTSVKSTGCEFCNSMKLDVCTCKSKEGVSNTPSNAHISTSSLENSVETTSLSDLPGNHVTCRRKHPRVIKDSSELCTATELNDSATRLPISNEFLQKSVLQNSSLPPLMRMHQDPTTICLSEKADSLDTRQKEEFNNILNKVCNKNENLDVNVTSQFVGTDSQDKTSIAGYDEFATGVDSGGSGSSANVNVPDSSTSENLNIQIPSTKELNKIINIEQSAKVTHTKTQYLLKVANVKNNAPIQPQEVVSINTINKSALPRIKAKSDESKIKILSDIKVDKSFNNSEIMGTNIPKVLKNATSTPLLQMQTIVINGTPVYKHNPFGQKLNYTKDEIMAMPTIILAPAPDSKDNPVSQTEDPGTDKIPTIATSNSARHLGPLIIDVTPSSNTSYVTSSNNNIDQQKKEDEKKFLLVEQKEETKRTDNTVPKTVDITSASAPKDNTVIGISETSTPQVIPPLRKSSSTPRRTSHVRVLDFTTPRRILHESINKCVPNMKFDYEKEVVLSKSPNVSIPVSVEEDIASKSVEESNSGSLKENSKKKAVKNWDADLRVLATISEQKVDTPLSPKSKSKLKSAKRGKSTKCQPAKKSERTEEKSSNKRKTIKSSKRKSIPEEDIEIITIPDEKVEVPLKPTINIIAGVDKNPNTSSELNKTQNKSNSDDNCDTPEMERISLQNEIGSKLNISDLLETPYKQVLYDIQMETPRFLGPDIPDDPMSDIKIMNIPTPRFLAAATPSSYSSRPTDYSSGGSYYKPEDQDYMRVHDDLDCPVTSTKESGTNDVLTKDINDSKEKENMKPSRPVRECTKNISYYNIASMSNKSRNIEKNETDTSVDSTGDTPTEKIPCTPITPKIKENKSKSDISKKGSSKKRKTPVKREMAKSFMKIKPRRPTPTKNSGRGKRKSSDLGNNSKVVSKKKGGNKEGSVSVTPVINSVPTKSRRKSSTPRKLHCSKSFHSESSGHDSPELVIKPKEKVPEPIFVNVQDTDTEQLPLQWSDDGSQEPQPVEISIPNETEDILKIKEYIETTVDTNKRSIKEEVSLHIDLVKRGFDLETAKSIERDLLDTPPHVRQEKEEIQIKTTAECEKVEVADSKAVIVELDKTLESDCSTSNKLQIVQNEDEELEEEFELSIHECNEDSTNYFTCSYDSTKDDPKTEQIKLKDKFSMEVCIDDGVSIRLRATPFSLLLDQDPESVEYLNYSYRETETAVSSISNFEKLYTPLKESFKKQCYEIFDSTLTSLDTPLKPRSPKQIETEISVTEIVLEVEKEEENEKVETKKRKRVHSGDTSDEDEAKTKKAKPETPLLFGSTNIQNFDIDSVLSKLHGP